ncbi:alpha/beta fold hydrolase [Persicimonas caeni]|uniref:Alpha/beta fold hydrolase n=1 Tax=Persicimonas caeni TaxID=2292766 RepID=A0A4Y6Q0G4_PERCE|nr:alpha/beta fold hydrolase [Persicimonas caeni]QDG53485.1 alpha/beta fold hydrolase [Persicimonas caeni]QED34706.1 alpha/beta fold hydrolase [Persicimonas caeni]
MAHITNDGVKVAYETHGIHGGTPIVLLMGLGLPGMIWHALVDDLVERDFFVVIPDNRGTGHSDAPLPPYLMSEMSDDVAMILDAEGIDEAMVVGVSFGGMLTQHVALNHPERVSGLLLAATTCGVPTGVFPRLESIWLLLKMVFASTTVTFEEAQKLFSHPESEERVRDLFSRWEDILDELPTPPWAVLGQLLAAAFHHTGNSLDQIRVPTRVVTGDSDFLIPPKNSEILAELIPNATLAMVPRAGHVFIHEHPESLLNNIIALREEVELKRSGQHHQAAQ